MISEKKFVLSADEAEIFNELKRRISEDFKNVDDFRIYRFLKGKQFDIKIAESVLRNHLQWREKDHIDTILQDYKVPEIIENHFPFYLSDCYDKEGAPLIFLEFGNIDSKGLLKAVKLEDGLRYISYVFENAEEILEKQSKKFNKPVTTFIGIIDFSNGNLLKVTNRASVEAVIQCAKLYESNYPERLKAAYVINASPYFSILFNLVKQFLSPITMNKVKVFGTTGWQEELRKVVDLDDLPMYLGGNKSNVIGNRTLPHSGEVPKSLYFRSSERRLIHKTGVTKYVVKSFNIVDIPYEVKVVGTRLEWEFETERHDVKFGLFYKSHMDSGEKKFIIPLSKVDCQMQQETGTYVCSEPGVYVIIFDNSYSWFRHKIVFCRSSICIPQEKTEQNDLNGTQHKNGTHT